MTLTVAGEPLIAFLLASIRILSWLAVVPPFAGRSVPMMAKLVLSLGLAFAVAASNGPRSTVIAGLADRVLILRVNGDAIPVDTVGLLFNVGTQVLVGVAMGFVTHLLLAAITAAGSMIDIFGGFSLAQGFDPQLDRAATTGLGCEGRILRSPVRDSDQPAPLGTEEDMDRVKRAWDRLKFPPSDLRDTVRVRPDGGAGDLTILLLVPEELFMERLVVRWLDEKGNVLDQRGLDRPGRAHHVPGHRLRRGHRHFVGHLVAQCSFEGRGLGGVVQLRRRAVGVHVVHGRRLLAGVLQGETDGERRPRALGVGCGDVEGVVGGAVAHDLRVHLGPSCLRPFIGLEDQRARALGEHEPVAIGVERTAGALRRTC